MSRYVNARCDGPGCEEELLACLDPDEPLAKGWLSVVSEDDEHPERDFCSMNCLSEWARLEALLP